MKHSFGLSIATILLGTVMSVSALAQSQTNSNWPRNSHQQQRRDQTPIGQMTGGSQGPQSGPQGQRHDRSPRPGNETWRNRTQGQGAPAGRPQQPSPQTQPSKGWPGNIMQQQRQRRESHPQPSTQMPTGSTSPQGREHRGERWQPGVQDRRQDNRDQWWTRQQHERIGGRTFGRRPGDWNRRPQSFDRHHYNFNIYSPHRFDWGGYRRPHGWYYHRWGFGERLPFFFWTHEYWLTSWWLFGLPVPPIGCEWIRVDNDALLIDTRTGEIIQVVYNVFW